jgi:hypothetical protein
VSLNNKSEREFLELNPELEIKYTNRQTHRINWDRIAALLTVLPGRNYHNQTTPTTFTVHS